MGRGRGVRPLDIVTRFKARVAAAWELAHDVAQLNPIILKQDERTQAITSAVHAETHKLEKALTIPEPRRPCGYRPLIRMKRLLATRESFSLDEQTKLQAAWALTSIQKWNDNGVNCLPQVIQKDAGKAAYGRYQNFFSTRHSVRSFDESKTIDPPTLSEIVALAQRAPSSCNRNPSRAHVFTDSAWIAEILRLQDGAAGFEYSTPALIVCTAQRAGYAGARERNQLWIDGALFAMTLVWVAHAKGLSSCILHWRYGQAKTRTLRRLAGIPESECVVCLIALGYGREGARVTPSARPPLDLVMTHHEQRRRN